MRKEVRDFVKELQKDGLKISYAKVARQFRNCRKIICISY